MSLVNGWKSLRSVKILTIPLLFHIYVFMIHCFVKKSVFNSINTFVGLDFYFIWVFHIYRFNLSPSLWLFFFFPFLQFHVQFIFIENRLNERINNQIQKHWEYNSFRTIWIKIYQPFDDRMIRYYTEQVKSHICVCVFWNAWENQYETSHNRSDFHSNVINYIVRIVFDNIHVVVFISLPYTHTLTLSPSLAIDR